MNTLTRICGALLYCGLASTAFAEPVAQQEPRPRIGLVLGGGGALGAAHVGVLKVLEELRVPVDCIAGTSMGALVGGAYASGMTAVEAESFITGIEWQRIFREEPIRRLQPMSVKRENRTVSNKLEFGLGEDGLIAPRALVETQQVESLLRSMVASQADVQDFDRLPIPFRAVATDLKSGDMVVFRDGDLPTALRASMSVPGAFAPVEVGDWLLVDGGIKRNLPVDVARETCADVVIAIAVTPPEPALEQMRSATGSLGRMIEILIRSNVQASLDSLGPRDVGISIGIDGMTAVDFHLAPQAIAQGERAARAATDRLRSLALSPAEYAAWRASHVAGGPAVERRVASVEFDGVDAGTGAWLASRISTTPGAELSEEAIARDELRIYATGAYESVGHRLEGPPVSPTVIFMPVPKAWGPTFLAFDYGLEASLEGDPLLVASALLRHTWPEAGGREWRALAQFGSESRLETDLRVNLDRARRTFVLPRIGAHEQREDLFFEDERIASYDQRGVYAELRAGVEMGNSGEVQLGLFRRQESFVRDIGPPQFAEIRDYDDGGFLLEYERDSRDSDLWATRGSRQRLELQFADAGLGAESAYRTALLEINQSVPFDRALLFLDIAGGSAFGTEPPVQQTFRLGGPGAMSGLEYGQLRGREFAYVQTGLGWRLVDVDPLLGMTLYAGAALEAGNAWERLDGTSGKGMLFGGRLFVGGNTPFGPVSLSLGYADTGDFAVYLGLGKPVMTRWR